MWLTLKVAWKPHSNIRFSTKLHFKKKKTKNCFSITHRLIEQLQREVYVYHSNYDTLKFTECAFPWAFPWKLFMNLFHHCTILERYSAKKSMNVRWFLQFGIEMIPELAKAMDSFYNSFVLLKPEILYSVLSKKIQSQKIIFLSRPLSLFLSYAI